MGESIEEKMFEKHHRFASLIASEFRNIPGLESSDIRQEAFIGLLKAIRTFNSANPTPFVAYAAVVIRNRIRSKIPASLSLIRWPLSIAWRLHAKSRRGDCSELSIGEKPVLPLENPDNLISPDEPSTSIDLDINIEDFISKLPEKYREVIHRRFGFSGESETLASVSKRIGCTKEYVRLLQIDALDKLRELIQIYLKEKEYERRIFRERKNTLVRIPNPTIVRRVRVKKKEFKIKLEPKPESPESLRDRILAILYKKETQHGSS
jgi:RNA polymerase sigma factor (sigma-70 family)